MQVFKLNKDYSIVCEWQNTRNGFRHVAVIMKNGYEIGRAKCTYLNRTWEYYEFQSVLQGALRVLEGKSVPENLLTRFKNKIEHRDFT